MLSTFEDIRPWLDHVAHAFEPDYPAVLPEVSANPVINILDRRRLPGRLPADVELIDIPCEYQVLRQNGAMEWLPSSSSELSDEPGFQTMVDFELCYPRNPPLPCSPVQNYAEASGYYSPDALPLALFDDHRPTNQYGA